MMRMACKTGIKGPCNINKTLVIDPSKTTGSIRLSDSAIMNYPWEGCVPARQFTGSLDSVLVVASTIIKRCRNN